MGGFMKLFSLIFVALMGLSANAASVHDCGYLDSIGNLMEPYKTFANGAIRVAYVSTEEPAAAPDHVLVFIYGPEMSVTCRAISQDDELGFSSVNMKSIKTKYSSTKGLLVTLTAYTWDGQVSTPQTLKIRVNQATQNVTLE
jgi:hypothetical protein